MAGQPSIDAYKELKIIYNPDDTLTRLSPFPSTTTKSHSSQSNQPIFTKDIPLNPTHKTWLRLFKPINPSPPNTKLPLILFKPINPSPPNTKLPLILFFHGGGLIICSASDTMFHEFCNSMAIALPAVILSLEYRLGPESRLPAAYEDAAEAIKWVQNQALDSDGESYLRDIVDFSICYLMGISARGNIAYHASLRSLSMDLQPLMIKGVILNQPFFGGLKRTSSELRLVNDKIFPMAFSDLMWELSLPKGSDRDHEYCNPTVDGSYKDMIGLLGRCFVSARWGLNDGPSEGVCTDVGRERRKCCDLVSRRRIPWYGPFRT